MCHKVSSHGSILILLDLTSDSLLTSHQFGLLQTSFYTNSSFVHPRSPHQCNRITESIIPLPARPLCCFRHYWPWHLDHPPLILVGIHGSVQVISVISLLPCQTWKWPVILVHILLQCPSRLCSWSFTLLSCTPLLSVLSFPLVP